LPERRPEPVEGALEACPELAEGHRP